MRALALLVVLAPALARAEDVGGLLSRPLSPGSVALLVDHAEEPGVEERWAAALSDPRPEVRATAARMSHVAGSERLAPKLRQTLAGESDADAAREEVRALLTLTNGAEDEQLLAAAKRFGSGMEGMFLEAVGRARGPGAVSWYVSHRSALNVGPGPLRSFYAAAGRRTKETLAMAGSRTLASGDADAWRALLAAQQSADIPLERGLAIAALGFKSPEIRGETAWYVSLASGTGALTLDDPTREALAVPSAGDVDLAFGVELLARLLGRPPVESAAWSARLKEPEPSRVDVLKYRMTPAAREALRHLTPMEQAAVSRRLWGNDRDLAKRLEGEEAGTGASTASRGVARTVAGFPKGLLPDILRVAGCALTEQPFAAAAQVTLRPDGRVSYVSASADEKRTPCSDVAAALFASALPPSGYVPRPSGAETLVVVLRKDSLDCLEERSDDFVPLVPRAGPEEELPGSVREPKKVTDVRPTYPPAARAQGKQGTVVLEAIISPTGCVQTLRLLRSADPLLDAEAMRTILGWRYTPTLLDGRPVPVIMTVSVSFHL